MNIESCFYRLILAEYEITRLRAALADAQERQRQDGGAAQSARHEAMEWQLRAERAEAALAAKEGEVAAAVAAFKDAAEKRVRELASCWVDGVTDVEREKGVSLMNAAENIARLPADRTALDRMLADSFNAGFTRGTAERGLTQADLAAARREGVESFGKWASQHPRVLGESIDIYIARGLAALGYGETP